MPPLSFHVALALLAACTHPDDLPDALVDQAAPPVGSPWAWEKQGAVGAGFGHAVAVADINRDGFDDALIGAPGFSGARQGSGRVYLYLGGPGGLQATAAQTWTGSRQGDALGVEVVFLGDVNADGFEDAAFGADAVDGAGRDRGAVYVVLGTPTGLATALPAPLVGSVNDRRLGGAIAAAGDTNGDGYDDMLVGIGMMNLRSRGYVSLHRGGPAGISRQPAATFTGGPYYGVGLTGAGDMDGDGYADFAIGEYSPSRLEGYEGGIERWRGGPGAPARARRDVIFGTGKNLSSGDLDADGHPEVLFGGRSMGTFEDFGTYPHSFGSFDPVSAAGVPVVADMTGDGVPDLLLGSGEASSDGSGFEGAVSLHEGPEATWSQQETSRWQGDGDDVGLGTAIAAGDFDGDGFMDALIGAPELYWTFRAPVRTWGRGSAMVWRGGPSGLPTWDPSLQLGSYTSAPADVAGGDINGDGLIDLVDISQPLVRWRLGTPGGLPDESDGSLNVYPIGDEDGVDTMCDVDGDGDDDLVWPVPRNLAVRVLWGEPTGLGVGPEIIQTPTQADSFLRATCAGDVNGDGMEDFVLSRTIGTSDENQLWYGSAAGGVSSGILLAPGAPGPVRPVPGMGSWVAADLDVDADGWSDIVVSDPATDHLSVWLGRLGGPAASPDHDWVGPSALGGGWGARIAPAGDVDGDGHDDLLVTSTWSGSDGRLGRVHLLRGTATGLDASPALTLDPIEPNTSLEQAALGGVGDMTGDGFADFGVGAYPSGATGRYPSLAAIHAGGPGLGATPWWRSPRGPVMDLFVPMGDAGADGFDDVLLIQSAAWNVTTGGPAWLLRGGAVEPTLVP